MSDGAGLVSACQSGLTAQARVLKLPDALAARQEFSQEGSELISGLPGAHPCAICDSVVDFLCRHPPQRHKDHRGRTEIL